MSIENDKNITTIPKYENNTIFIYLDSLLEGRSSLGFKDIYSYLKSIEDKLYNGKMDTYTIANLAKYISQKKNLLPYNSSLETLLLIGLQILISNYLIEQGLEDIIEKLETEGKYENSLLINTNIKTLFKELNNFPYQSNDEKFLYKTHFLLLNYLQIFKYNFLYLKLKKNKDINTLYNHILSLFEENLSLLKTLYTNLKVKQKRQPNYFPDTDYTDYIKFISTIISFSNYYFILLEFIYKNLSIEFLHKNNYHELLTEYPTISANIYILIFQNILKSKQKNYLKEFEKFTTRTLIVTLGNIKLLQKIYNQNNTKLDEITLLLEKIINEYYYNTILENIQSNGIENRFLNFYSGLQFDLNSNENSLILKEFNYPSLKNLLEYDPTKDKSNIRRILSFLKNCPFDNIKKFATIFIFILPNDFIKDTFLEEGNSFTIEHINYIKDISGNFEKLLYTTGPGHGIEYYKNFLEISLGINIKNINFYIPINYKPIYLHLSKTNNIIDINKFKGTYFSFFPLDSFSGIFIDNITKTIFIYNVEKNYIIEVKNKFIDLEFTKKKKESFEKEIFNLSDIITKKLYSYLSHLKKLDNILVELSSSHPETIYHMELMSEILYKILQNEKVYQSVSKEIEYLTTGFFLSKKDLTKFLAYLHDIGKSSIDKDMIISSKINRITHIEVFNYILKNLLNNNSYKQGNISLDYKKINFKELIYVFKSFIRNNFSNDIQEIKKEIINLDIYNKLSDKILQLSLKIFKKHQKKITNFLENYNINECILFNDHSYQKLKNKLNLQQKYIDHFFVFLYAFIDILMYEQIKDIQIPHITKGRDILLETPSLLPFYRCTEHHKYPSISKKYTSYLRNIASYFKKFPHLKKYGELLDKKCILAEKSITNKDLYRKFPEKDPLTSLIVISDIISALYFPSRSYINHQLQTQREILKNIKQCIINKFFLKFIEEEINTASSSISKNQIFNILDNELKENPFREKIKDSIKSFIDTQLASLSIRNEIKSKINKLNTKNELKDTLSLNNIYIVIPPQKSIPIKKEKGQTYLFLPNLNKNIKISTNIISTYIKFTKNSKKIKNISNKHIIIGPEGKSYNCISSEILFKSGIIFNYPPNIPFTFYRSKNEVELFVLEDNPKNYILQNLPWKINFNLKIPKEIEIKNCYFEGSKNNSINIKGPSVSSTTIKNFEKVYIETIKEKNYIQGNIIKIKDISLHSQKSAPSVIKGENIEIEKIKGRCIVMGNNIKIHYLHTSSIIISTGVVEIDKIDNKCYIICKNKNSLFLPEDKTKISIYETTPEYYIKDLSGNENISLKRFKELLDLNFPNQSS